jgi:hypothetical protein
MNRPELGTVIHGTLRTRALLRAFADELEYLQGEVIHAVYGSGLVADAREWAARIDTPDCVPDDEQTATEILYDIADALNECAPDGCYFGAHVGDGSDFGFWECES